MISVTSAMGAKLMTLTLSGKVSGKEYTEICKVLEKALSRNQTVDFLCELEGFRGIGLSVMWRAARVSSANSIKLRRVAVVGQSAGYKWARILVRGFHAETRYFDPGNRTHAVRWLNASNPVRTDAGTSLAGDAGYRQASIRRDQRRSKSQKRQHHKKRI